MIVAFDIGDKRIGVAYSDPAESYAIPSETYFRTGKFSDDVAAVAKIAREAGAQSIVCGLPLYEDGGESPQSEKTRAFAAALERAAGIPVTLSDERNTTRAARGDLIAMGKSVRGDKKKKRVDSLAAAYILEGYLEERRQHMKEVGNQYDDDNVVELIDEEGKTYRYEHILTFAYKGEWYCALAPEGAEEGDEDEGDEVAIYHLVGGEDDEQLETIEDETLLDEVFAEFCNQYEDFEDADEAERLDSDDEE